MCKAASTGPGREQKLPVTVFITFMIVSISWRFPSKEALCKMLEQITKKFTSSDGNRQRKEKAFNKNNEKKKEKKNNDKLYETC